MLVLSRKTNESIVVTLPDGRDVVLTVVEIRGDKVRLGITAARDIAVHREEIWDLIQQEKEITQ